MATRSCSVFLPLAAGAMVVFWFLFYSARIKPNSLLAPGYGLDPVPLKLHSFRYSQRKASLDIASNSSIKGLDSIWSDGNLEQTTEELLEDVVQELHRLRPDSKLNEDQCVEKIEDLANEKSGKKLQVFGRSLHSFILFNAYRYSMDRFYIIGLVSKHFRRLGASLEFCNWISAESGQRNASDGLLSLDYVEDKAGNEDYEVLVAKCSFDDPVGANAEGGFLVLNSNSSVSENWQVLKEKPDDLLAIQFEGPFRFKYGYCSPPLWSKISAKNLKEWIMFHHSILQGQVHYFFYDLTEQLQGILQPLIETGYVTIVDMKEILGFTNSKDVIHRLVINDCLHRTRYTAEWLFSWSLEEYLQIDEQTNMTELLEVYKNVSWISFGNLIWSRVYCYDSSEDDAWEIEKMPFRLKDLICGEKNRALICHGEEGNRKWLVNPRNVVRASIHRTLEPEWDGIILNGSIARLNHYKGLSSLEEEQKNCQIFKDLDKIRDDEAVDGWWWKDTSFRCTIQKARFFSYSTSPFNESWYKKLAYELPS